MSFTTFRRIGCSSRSPSRWRGTARRAARRWPPPSARPEAGIGLPGPREDRHRQGRVRAGEVLTERRRHAEKKPVTAPTTRSGAVSPNALARVRMVPVRIPGAAEGRTWLLMTSHRVAPTPKPASRMLSRHRPQRLGGGDDHDRQHQCRHGDAGRDDVLARRSIRPSPTPLTRATKIVRPRMP